MISAGLILGHPHTPRTKPESTFYTNSFGRVAASAEHGPNLNPSKNTLARMRDSELTDDFTTARLLSYLIGEFQITNRRQRRFLPEAARSEKEAFLTIS